MPNTNISFLKEGEEPKSKITFLPDSCGKTVFQGLFRKE